MLYLLFIVALAIVIYAVVFLTTRGGKQATEDPDKLPEPENPPGGPTPPPAA